MKLRLATRVSLLIVGLIVFIVVALSGALLVQFGAVMSEMHRSNSEAISSALLEQAEKQGTGLTQLLAEALTNPLFQYRIDVIYDLVSSARDKEGIVYVYAYDEAGALVSDGTETLEAYGKRMDEPTRKAIAAGRGFTWTAENTLHVAAPVKIGSRVLGSVMVGVSLEEIAGDIAAIESVLAGISKTGVANHIFATSLAAVVLAALGVFLSVLVARGLARPIEAIAGVTRRIGRGEYDVQVPVDRSDEIGDLAAAFNQMVENLARSEKSLRAAQDELLRKTRLSAMGQITATVSHELRNPLGTIRTSMATIRDRTRDKGLGLERAVDRVDRNIDRCDGIITELLDYARDTEPVRVATRIDDWLGEVLNEQVPPAGITVRRDLSSGAEAAFDRDTLRQAVVNVFQNACQAMAEADDGEKEDILTVATRTDGTSVAVSFTDTGPGIAAENLDKIFEPLFSTRTFGVGLGLPLVQKILEQHGGRVEVESAPGSGTRAVLWLPLAEEKAEHQA